MKLRAKRVKTEPNLDEGHSHSSLSSPRTPIGRSHDPSRKCACCSQNVKYPDYLTQLRRERLEREEKERRKKSTEKETSEFETNPAVLERVEETIDEYQQSSHKKRQ